MGVAFVFLIYIVLAVCLAVPAGAVGAWIGGRIARKTDKKTKHTFRIAGIVLPFLAGGYLLAWVAGMSAFGIATGRDFGFGDGFEIPLHNGYHWSAIDEPTAACVYVNKDEFSACGSDQRNSFYEVDWLAGSFDGRSYESFPPEDRQPDHWFLFNTRTHERVDAISEAELRQKAAQHGVALSLQSSADFYGSHRYHWYDFAIGLMLLLPGIAVMIWLYRKTRRMLREAAMQTGPEVVTTR